MSISELLKSIKDKASSIKNKISIALQMISNKGGSYVGDNMNAVIDGIDSLIGSNELQNKEAIIPIGKQTIVADEGYKGLNSVSVTAVDEVYIADSDHSHGGNHKITKGYIESAVTNTSGYLAVGAASNNRLIINGDLHLSHFTKQTIGNGMLFRLVNVLGSLYMPNCETLNNDKTDDASYGSALAYSEVFGDVHLPKLKNGCILFSGKIHKNLYLGNYNKGGVVRIDIYDSSRIGGIIVEDGFGNSLYLTARNATYSRSHDELIQIINNVYDFATDPLDGFTPTLSFGTVNLDKLSDEEKAIATAKGWTLA